MPDVHIIGAGPVGLATAIQIKLRAPKTKVRITERHKIYQRQHVVRLNPESIKGMIALPPLADLHRQLSKRNVIRTHDLENLLLEQAKKLGVEILYKKVEAPREILSEFPQTAHIVGADGSHSLCRKQLFGNRFLFSKPLQYVIEIKYEVTGTTQRLPTEKILELESRFGDFRPIEYIGKLKEGVTPVTLWVLVDEKTFTDMKGATFKTPYFLRQDKNKMPSKLLTTIHNWIGARSELLGDIRARTDARITTLKLGAYASLQVTRKERNVQWTLVGDAALGVPFFRSLNNGMIASTAAARAIAEDILERGSKKTFFQKTYQTLKSWIWTLVFPSSARSYSKDSSFAMKTYAVSQTWLAYKEYTFAFLKSLAIRVLTVLLWLKKRLREFFEQMDLEPFNIPA